MGSIKKNSHGIRLLRGVPLPKIEQMQYKNENKEKYEQTTKMAKKQKNVQKIA